jgi:hypothetical protein
MSEADLSLIRRNWATHEYADQLDRLRKAAADARTCRCAWFSSIPL